MNQIVLFKWDKDARHVLHSKLPLEPVVYGIDKIEWSQTKVRMTQHQFSNCCCCSYFFKMAAWVWTASFFSLRISINIFWRRLWINFPWEHHLHPSGIWNRDTITTKWFIVSHETPFFLLIEPVELSDFAYLFQDLKPLKH